MPKSAERYMRNGLDRLTGSVCPDCKTAYDALMFARVGNVINVV